MKTLPATVAIELKKYFIIGHSFQIFAQVSMVKVGQKMGSGVMISTRGRRAMVAKYQIGQTLTMAQTKRIVVPTIERLDFMIQFPIGRSGALKLATRLR